MKDYAIRFIRAFIKNQQVDPAVSKMIIEWMKG